MGFFSKLWKGIKKTFKKIFKPIKKVFKSIGKFMGKIGVVGQVAMMFLPIPGLGTIFGGLGKAGSQALGWLNKFGAVGQGAAKILGSGYKFARAVAKPFVDITKGVKGFFEDITKYVGSKIPGISDMIKSKPVDSIFGGGPNSAWGKAQEKITGAFDGFRGNMSDAFSMNIDDLLPKDKLAKTAATTAVGDDFKFELGETRKPVSPDVSAEYDFDYETPVSEGVKTTDPATFGIKRTDPVTFADDATATTKSPGLLGDIDIGAKLREGGEKLAAKVTQPIRDPVGTFIDKSFSSLLSPEVKPPEMFDPLRISPNFMSQKYDMMRSSIMQTELPVFNQDPDVLGMMDMGLLQGGLMPGMQEGMGYGGSDFNSVYNMALRQRTA